MDYRIHLFFTSGKDLVLPAVSEATKDELVAMFMEPPYNSVAFTTPTQTVYVSVDKVEYFSVTSSHLGGQS